jgi:hypothetical protein
MSLLFFAIGIGIAIAQVTKVKGVIVDSNDEPVIGASVIVKGTTLGTVTDMDGNYTLERIPASAKMLVISYVGMETQEVPIKSGLIKTLRFTEEILYHRCSLSGGSESHRDATYFQCDFRFGRFHFRCANQQHLWFTGF